MDSLPRRLLEIAERPREKKGLLGAAPWGAEKKGVGRVALKGEVTLGKAVRTPASVIRVDCQRP